MISKYVRNSVPIDAVQFTGGEENGREIVEWVERGGDSAAWSGGECINDSGRILNEGQREQLTIKSRSGTTTVSLQDWLIRDEKGDLVVSLPAAFGVTFTKVANK